MAFRKRGSVTEESRYSKRNSAIPDQFWSLKSLVSRIKKKKESDLEGFMVIGIDFGTTYSGAAWATVQDFENDQINLITTWPDARREEGKAPTELYFEDDKVSWGYGIPTDADPIRWFKLLLLRDEDLTDEIRGSEFLILGRKMLRESNKTATDLIADYLRAFWRHIISTIQRARSASVVDALTFHVVITVPAIWKDYTRMAMQEAARKAGILEHRAAGSTTLSFAPEPEAAALATLCERGQDIKTDDVYVICDAGGGTVDLISYRVGELDPIELHEAVIGTGGLCGGIFIDEAFQTICKNRLGRQWNKLSQTGIKEIMKDEWEYAIKTTFAPDANKEYIVAIPAEAINGSNLNDNSKKPIIKNGRIHFSSSDIQKAFSKAFSKIGKLVDGQITQTKENNLRVKGIILVGGLGSSPYLYEYLSSRYASKNIEVLQATGVRPRTAICRGAIYKGFLDGPNIPMVCSPPLSVVSTIARQSLGLEFYTPFEKGVHSEENKFWDKVEGVWMANGQMEWYLKKGMDVSKKSPVKHSFYRAFTSRVDFKSIIFSGLDEEILYCEDENPPETRTSEVKTLCSIDCQMKNVTYDSLRDFSSASGKRVKKMDFEVEMVPSGASTEFVVYCQGRRLGSQNASIHFQ